MGIGGSGDLDDRRCWYGSAHGARGGRGGRGCESRACGRGIQQSGHGRHASGSDRHENDRDHDVRVQKRTCQPG